MARPLDVGRALYRGSRDSGYGHLAADCQHASGRVTHRSRHSIWQAISGGKECVSCQATPNNWFTAVHQRENMDLLAGTHRLVFAYQTARPG